MTIFSKIIAGEVESAKVYEDDIILAFMDNCPQTHGHTLIIPKLPAVDLLTLDEQTISHIAIFSKKLAKAQLISLNADGIRIMQFNGAAAGQTVFHYHLHSIPMYHGVNLKGHASEAATLQQLQTTAATIAAALEN